MYSRRWGWLAEAGLKIDCIVTSPPFYGQRDYGVRGQIGLEVHPRQYIERLVKVFDTCARVLKPTGSLWVNIGDTYWSGRGEHRSGVRQTRAGDSVIVSRRVPYPIPDYLVSRPQPCCAPASRSSRLAIRLVRKDRHDPLRKLVWKIQDQRPPKRKDEKNEIFCNRSRVDRNGMWKSRQRAERAFVLRRNKSRQQSRSVTTTTLTGSCIPAAHRSAASGTSLARPSVTPRASRCARGGFTDSRLSLASPKKRTFPGDDTLVDRTPDDISDLIRDDVFTIWAEPNAAGDMRTAANLEATNVETVVIRPRGDKGGRQVVQPLSVEVTDGTVASNLFGASVQIFGVVATFSSDAVREIIAQNDMEVLLITGSREEFKCNLDDTRLQRGYNP